MKISKKVLLGLLFLGTVGISMADEDHRDDRDGVRIIVAPKHHHRRRHHPKPKVHTNVDLHIGLGDHHDDRQDDHR